MKKKGIIFLCTLSICAVWNVNTLVDNFYKDNC